ncbi:MAG: DUF3883 domain-containing protein [Agitococcus sp.]|nr:DUF3883 domain-containing protein [Agitococcus sp.]
MKKFLETLIDSQLTLYKAQPDRMISDFNREKELIGEYNGRQLLELLQNADDEEASTVLFDLNIHANTLTIANTGKSFCEKGFKSLMISNLSSKTKARFIGNKGLGFRSIINWSNKIVITSNGLAVEFSESIAKSTFHEIFSEDERNLILAERELKTTAVPFAFLARPRLMDGAKTSWSTQICISYKEEYLKDIQEQIRTLLPETLLFLNHINEIHIRHGDSQHVISKKKNDDESHVTIGNDTWIIYEKTDLLPTELQDKNKLELEYYSLKIALTPNLDKASDKLFTFFPTKVDINFPMVIHGTFDLDSSRNQLNNTPKNKYILDRLIELIVDTAKQLSGQDISWRPIKLLRYKGKNAVLKDLGFYEKIDNAVKELEIFPCIDNKYRKASDIYYLDKEFSLLVASTDNVELFPWLLKYDDEMDLFRHLYRLMINKVDFKGLINALSTNLLKNDIDRRVELIFILSRASLLKYNFELLTNKDGSLISSDNEVYTPVTSSTEDFKLPDFVKIDFINTTLFERLVKKLDLPAIEPARELQRKIKEITTILSYEPAPVLAKIISSTNKKIIETPNDGADFISKMVISLYQNFIQLGSDSPPSLAQAPKIQLLDRNGDIKDARTLYFGSGYPSGTLTERLFSQIYKNDELLAEPHQFSNSLISENPEDLEKFFMWLGVNRYVKYQELQHDKSYIDYVFTVISRPESFRDAELKATAIAEKDLERICLSLSKEEIVMWILNDSKVGNQLNIDNSDLFKYSKLREHSEKYHHTLPHKPSYISYQLKKRAIFDDFLILDDSAIEFINPFQFDYAHQIFVDNSIKRRDIEVTLSKLGAKDKFEDLSFDRMSAIVKGLPESDPSGAHTQKIYKLALEHYKKHNRVMDAGCKLFAKRGKNSAYFEHNAIYFSDNIKLPQKIVEEKALLNFPRRAGSQPAIAFFRIHDLNKIKVTAIKSTIIPSLTAHFQGLFNQLKPYLLAYRIEKLQKEKDAEASKMNRLSIELCSSINFLVDGEEFTLSGNEYVNEGSRYFVKINGEKTVTDLKQDSSFCDTFAEILCSAFMVSEHRLDFRNVLRSELADVEHVIQSELGIDALVESKALLGLSNPFTSFWYAILCAIDKSTVYDITESNLPNILSSLDIQDLDINELDYASLSTPKSAIAACKILVALKISVEQFNKTAYYKINLFEHHKNRLSSKMNEMFDDFKFSLWKSIKDQLWPRKMLYLSGIAIYEHSQKWIVEEASNIGNALEINYAALVISFIQSNFSELTLSPSEDFQSLYNFHSDQLSSDELDLLSSEIKSMLYFEGGLDEVKKYLLQLTPPRENEGSEKQQPAPSLPNEEFSTKASPQPNNSAKSRRTPYKHSQRKDADNKKSGDEAEIVVFNCLTNEYGNKYVEHVAKRDDSLGYDIRYSPDKGLTWKYVEVKRYSGERFFLTKNEREFSEQNIGNYEVFLVTTADEIIPLKDIDYSDEDRFMVIANEYTVSFTLIRNS